MCIRDSAEAIRELAINDDTRPARRRGRRPMLLHRFCGGHRAKVFLDQVAHGPHSVVTASAARYGGAALRKVP